MDIEQDRAGFFFLYLCELDSFLHTHCNEPEKIAGKLAWYEEQLRLVFAAALRRDREAKFFLFSDHGMTPVRRHYDLAADIDACGLRMPQDYLAVYDSTMARFWFFSGQARVAITDCLRRVPCGRLLPEDELRQLGVLFPDNRYGEAILLMEPGTLDCYQRVQRRRLETCRDARIPSRRPAFRRGFSHQLRTASVPLSTVTDIYRYMRESVS